MCPLEQIVNLLAVVESKYVLSSRMNEILINVVHNIIEDDVPYADLLVVWEVIDIAIQVL